MPNRVARYELSFKTKDGHNRPLTYKAEIIAVMQPEAWIAEDPMYINRALRDCVLGKAATDKLRACVPTVIFLEELKGIAGGLKFKTETI